MVRARIRGKPEEVSIYYQAKRTSIVWRPDAMLWDSTPRSPDTQGSTAESKNVSLKSTLKQYVPSPILSRIQRAGLRHDMYRSAGRTHKEIFSEIYESNLWRGEPGAQCSGPGSHEKANDHH